MLAGYGRNRAATGVHDDLFAKAVVVRDPDRAIAIVTLDNIGLTRPDVLRIRKGVATALPDFDPHGVIITSTHTHSGPDAVGLWGPALWKSGRDEAYVVDLTHAAVRAVITANARVRPATSRIASEIVRFDWVENRSEPDLLDLELSVIQFVDAAGAAIATLANYACHPTVLGGDNTRVSADYLVGYYLEMAHQHGGEHLFLQGAIGGWVQPLEAADGFDQAERFGRELAGETTRLLGHARDNPYSPLAIRHATFDIPLENWGFRLMMWLGVLQRDLFDGAMRTETSWFRIGAAEFVTHPGETSPAYSLASRAAMQADVEFVLGLTGDAIGYILKPGYFDDDAPYPHAEYLRSVSVGPGAGPLLMETLEPLIGAEG
jgi:hypothetical protein